MVIIFFLLFEFGLFDKNCDKIRYLIIEKSGATDSINHNFGKIKINVDKTSRSKECDVFH